MNYRDRRCIALARLLGQSKTLSYLLGPTDALLAVCFFLCIFSKQASLVRLRYHDTFFYLYLTNHSAVSKPHPTECAEMYAAAGFLAAVKCAVRCARRSVVVVVRLACAVRCSFVAVTLLFPTSMIFFQK